MGHRFPWSSSQFDLFDSRNWLEEISPTQIGMCSCWKSIWIFDLLFVEGAPDHNYKYISMCSNILPCFFLGWRDVARRCHHLKMSPEDVTKEAAARAADEERAATEAAKAFAAEMMLGEDVEIWILIDTPPKINIFAPEKWWLEDDPFLLGRLIFRVYVKLREGMFVVIFLVFWGPEDVDVWTLLFCIVWCHCWFWCGQHYE